MNCIYCMKSYSRGRKFQTVICSRPKPDTQFEPSYRFCDNFPKVFELGSSNFLDYLTNTCTSLMAKSLAFISTA